jgi:hypothetical protein
VLCVITHSTRGHNFTPAALVLCCCVLMCVLWERVGGCGGEATQPGSHAFVWGERNRDGTFNSAALGACGLATPHHAGRRGALPVGQAFKELVQGRADLGVSRRVCSRLPARLHLVHRSSAVVQRAGVWARRGGARRFTPGSPTLWLFKAALLQGCRLPREPCSGGCCLGDG